MSQFVFAEGKKIRCTIVEERTPSGGISAGDLLADKIRELTGTRPLVVSDHKAVATPNAIYVGALSQDAHLRSLLERQQLLIGPDCPAAADYGAETDVRSVRLHRLAMAKASMLRQFHHCLERMDPQEFFVFRPDIETLLVAGAGEIGALYAVHALANHMFVKDGLLVVEDLHSRGFPVWNRPAFPNRGMCTNIGGPDHIGLDQWVKEWKVGSRYDYGAFIDWIFQFRINHINIWLFELDTGIAYDSRKFPECVNPQHPNVRQEFIGPMIDYAHARSIDVTVFLDFPDFAHGVIRTHPELAAVQTDPKAFPPERDWRRYQRTGENPNKHDFRGRFGTFCAAKPQVLRFWEQYIDELFQVYPGLDGVMGQFAEGLGGVCECDNCQTHFLELQWKFFKRMAEAALSSRPDRTIFNCASPGAALIEERRQQIPNFVQLGWGNLYLPYAYGLSRPSGEWYLLHHLGGKWTESEWHGMSRVLQRWGFSGIMKRSVSYKDRENDHFAFSEFAWNPELSIDDFADLYVKRTLRRKDPPTADLYAKWIKTVGMRRHAKELATWTERGLPIAGQLEGTAELQGRLRAAEKAMESAVRTAAEDNAVSHKVKEAYETYRSRGASMNLYELLGW